jgi:exoribonuclease R
VIRTKERMTYTDVAVILSPEEGEGPLKERYGYLYPDFHRMHALFEILRARRDAAAPSTSTYPRPM